MAITIEEFESEPIGERRPSAARAANADRVRRFLSERADRAFTIAEIREGAGFPRASVCNVRARLEDEGGVGHRGGCWTVGQGTDAEPTTVEQSNERSPPLLSPTPGRPPLRRQASR